MPTIEREQYGTVVVSRLRGEFITDESVSLIERALSGWNIPEVRCVVINWSAVERINSANIGAVLRVQGEISKHGRHYRNCAFSQLMIELVPLMKMVYKWNYFETEEEAVHSCPGLPAGRLAGGDPTSGGPSGEQ